MQKRKSERLDIVFKKSTYDRLKQISEKEQCSISELIRRILYESVCAFEEKNGVIELPKEEENQ